MLPVQIIGMLFALCMIYFSYLYYRKKTYSKGIFLFWLIVWISFIVLVLFPRLITSIADNFEFARKLDMFIVLGILFILGVVYYCFNTVTKLKKDMEDVVREVAIMTVEEPEEGNGEVLE